MERLERAIEGIQTSIEDEGGSCIIKMKARFLCFFCHHPLLNGFIQPKTVSDLDDADLAERMAKASKENEEVSGDEDDEVEL